MELFLGLALILIIAIGLIELKEYRQVRREKSRAREQRLLRKSLGCLVDEMKVLQEQIGHMNARIDQGHALMNEAKEIALKAHEFSEKAAVDLNTIVKEYDINGTAMGIRRNFEEADFIEGV